MTNKPKILFNFADWNHTPERKKQNTYGGVGYYRIIKVAEQLKDKYDVRVVGKEILHFGDTLEQQWDNVFKEYDVFWTTYFSDDKVGAAIFYHAQKHGKKVIIDLDDNYLDIPESNLIYDRFKEKKHERAFLSTILSFADAITVSTEPLKERIHTHIKHVHGIDKPIFVLPNMNDIKDWDFEPIVNNIDKVVIGYTGSNSHQDDLKMCLPAIAKLMKKYPNLYLEMIGSVPKDRVKETFGYAGFDDAGLERIKLLPATATFKEYPQYLSEQKWDIGICPLVDTAFTRSKSHIKWLEYSVFKLPTVASRVYPYFMQLKGRKTIVDGKTGLLARNNEWEAKLEKLITNPTLRKELGENAYNQVKDTWQYDKQLFLDTVDKMLK
jgi:glycosyltransferase involved in cell wall biosynthesis